MLPRVITAVGVLLFTVRGVAFSQSVNTHTDVQKSSAAPTCATCHVAIANSYRKTAMANASGPAEENLTAGEFQDKDSGVRYRVSEREAKAWMNYTREGKDSVRGDRELLYFLGSGKKGRSYLFNDKGFWFVAPIIWYSQEKKWATAEQTYGQPVIANIPASASCMSCHASAVQAPVPGTDNKFSGEPFLHAGITCERCHDAGEAHERGKGPIVNPAKLPAKQRDAICMQCHFQGTVAVSQPGKHLYQFQPGEELSDYKHYFLMVDDPKLETPQALSQYEALSQSACKRKSEDKMWCGSCHDPHGEPAPDEAAAYYRGKCVECHGAVFAKKHYPDKTDCRPCHMPAVGSKQVTHAESTDHRIMRFPSPAPLPQLQVRGKPLTAFPASDDASVTTRDLALAWNTLAQRGLEGAAPQAEEYLRKALKEQPEDAELLTQLGLVELQHQRDGEARTLYERALKIDPLQNDAAANLGVLEARAGNLKRAVELWQQVFERVPRRSSIGLNLAVAFCLDGQKNVARDYVQRVLDFTPEFEKGQSLLQNLNKDPVQCKP